MRFIFVLFLCSLPAGLLVQAEGVSPEEVMERHFRMARETVYTASYVLSGTATFQGEEIFSVGGSLILWMEYPRARLEATGLEDIMFPVNVVDFEGRILYSFVPQRGWAKHVLSGEWLSMVDPRYDPLLRRTRYTGIEETSLGGTAVWVVRGTIAPDPLGLLPRAEVTFWIDKETYIDRKVLFSFDLHLPGLDLTTSNRFLSELTSFREVADIPDERFAVPEGVLPAPDADGRVFPYPAPDLRATTVTGEEISLGGLSGNVVVVFFWDIGAEIEENLVLNLLLMEGIRRRGEGKGVAVIGVVDGDPEGVADLLEGFEVGMPTVVARKEWAAALGVTEETQCVVIDQEGNVYAKTDPFTVPSILLELLDR